MASLAARLLFLALASGTAASADASAAYPQSTKDNYLNGVACPSADDC
jgi:hypothetical protein